MEIPIGRSSKYRNRRWAITLFMSQVITLINWTFRLGGPGHPKGRVVWTRRSARDEVGRADQRGADGLALVCVRERLVDLREGVAVRQDRAVGVALVRTLEELEPV